MFGIKKFEDLDVMTIILIVVIVILVLYFIRRSCNYSFNLIEGNTLRDKNNNTKYKFSKAIENWEKSSIKYQESDVSNIKSLANAIMSDLAYNTVANKKNNTTNSDNYKDMMIDLEDIANSFSVILCVDMVKQINKMGTQSMTEDESSAGILFEFLGNASGINTLQEFKRNLVDIHDWNPTTTASVSEAKSKIDNLFGGSKSSSSSSSKSSSKSSSSSASNFF